jgi:ABC-type transporter Mla MlaB component
MGAMTADAPVTARFILRGSRPLSLEVEGSFDRGAALGFRALIPSLVGAAEVKIDLSGCDRVDGAAIVAVHEAMRRVRASGGAATLTGSPSGGTLLLGAATA